MRIIVLVLIIILSGCMGSNSDAMDPPNNPTPTTVLKENPDADILYKGNTVYQNASDIEWVMESGFKKGDDLGVVEKQVKKPEGFRNLTATHLLVGTKLYEAENISGDVIIAETEEGDIPYLAMKEG